MKKLLSVMMVMALLATLFAGCGSKQEEAPAANLPGSALEILENVWAGFGEDEKFPVIGGSMAAPVDNAPGSYDLADENISYSLLIPAQQLGNVTEAASMIHMMNANSFTCAAYKLADGVKAADFGAAMKAAILNNQWMCGFPDRLLVSSFGDSYVVVAFGVNDAMTPFASHLAAVYPEAQTVANDPIA